MKKLVTILCAAMLFSALAGCASGNPSSSSASSASSPESASAEASSEASASAGSSGSVGIPNPWTDTDSAEAAAAGAGVGSFDVAENLGLASLSLFDPAYRYMDGIAQVQLQGGAFDVTVRKSLTIGGMDLSGDYTDYPEFWVSDVDGVEVSCHGFKAGEATAFEWCANDANYSVLFRGLGGENMAVGESEVASVVASVK